ncbi:hypothetical protein HGRIS_011828 [Hohenbuehelia grisea]|uniref:DJ-1/PfpI domain-containing protein n=1 Tax=Hohenbuehelia grisea TaxID=104357 RepID=A0ABR3JX31_9AGAR
MTSSPANLTVAVCLYDQVTSLDYQGPVELLGSFQPEILAQFKVINDPPPAYTMKIEFLAHTRDPVKPNAGPRLHPDKTFEEAQGTQYDILFIPGGNALNVPNSLLEFIKKQAPGAKHILTVCTGSWVLANTGYLRGKKATSNKFVFKMMEEATKDLGVTWVRKARWVVEEDNKLWTSSGVTAGMDMANAFLEYLVGKEKMVHVRAVVELTARSADDDEFAAFYGLV